MTWPRGSITISLAPRFAACLKKVAATGWFSVGRAPMMMMTSASATAVNGAVTAPEPIPSINAATEEAWQSRVQWSTLLLEPGADELLEEIGLLVGPLGRPETGKRALPPRLRGSRLTVADALEARRGEVEGLFPARLAKMSEWVRRIDVDVVLRYPLLADQRLGQPVGMRDVIKAETALDAEPVVVGRPVSAVDRDDPVIADPVGQLTAHPAIGTHALDLAVGRIREDAIRVDQARRHQRAGRTGLHAFAAGDASAGPHRVVEIEDDLLVMAAPRHADHIVDLHFAAGADTKGALDAGVELHCHRRMAAVGRRRRQAREAAVADAELVGPSPQPRIGVVRRGTRGLIADQELEHHLAREPGALARGLDLHARSRLAHARRGEHPFAVDLDHAGAAIAVRAISRLG